MPVQRLELFPAPPCTGAGDRDDAVRRAYLEHHEPLRQFIARRGASDEDAADILQDVYVRISRLGNLLQIQNLRAFLYATALNLVRDHKRRQQTRSIVVRVEDGAMDAIAAVGTPESISCARQRLRLMEEALASLPQAWRQALILHRFHDMTYDDIAQTLGVTTRSVQTYIARALEHIDRSLRHPATERAAARPSGAAVGADTGAESSHDRKR